MVAIFIILITACALTLARNGVVRHESIMSLRNKLEELGKIKGVNLDEKGGYTPWVQI